ncbi:MAG: hypothetical protein WB053_11300, partial [Nitrososphaeraceae archaeon]
YNGFRLEKLTFLHVICRHLIDHIVHNLIIPMTMFMLFIGIVDQDFQSWKDKTIIRWFTTIKMIRNILGNMINRITLENGELKKQV